MIKRRFYKVDHGNRDALNASSSSSNAEVEAKATGNVPPETGEVENEPVPLRVIPSRAWTQPH
ncbi:hypothetical protein PIB30_030532, partial [Stylosanthes scabra]|nr:hypothetical protein [Stylosanthes scabra]